MTQLTKVNIKNYSTGKDREGIVFTSDLKRMSEKAYKSLYHRNCSGKFDMLAVILESEDDSHLAIIKKAYFENVFSYAFNYDEKEPTIDYSRVTPELSTTFITTN